jgi:hypothetical protein
MVRFLGFRRTDEIVHTLQKDATTRKRESRDQARRRAWAALAALSVRALTPYPTANSLPPTLSLSLTHTHTHIYTYTCTHTLSAVPPLSLFLSLCVYAGRAQGRGSEGKHPLATWPPCVAEPGCHAGRQATPP